MKTKAALAMAAVGLLAAVALAAPAQGPDGKGQVVLSWDQFIKITGYDPAQKGGPGVLTIPWNQVQELLGVKVEDVGAKTTVDLPWEEFKALLEWSIKRKEPKPSAPAPTDYIITSSQYLGKLGDDSATITRKLTIQVLREKGWKRIPVLPTGVAITKAELPKDVYLNSTSNHYELLTEASGKLEVSLEFAAKVYKSAGTNQVRFVSLPLCSSVLDLRIAREKVDVKVANSQSLVVTGAAGETAVAAAIPSGAQVEVTWERALPKVEAAPTKLYAETRTLVAVAEGVLLCQEMVHFSILHTPVRELALAVPKGVSVLDVSGSKVQDWRVDEKGQLAVVLSSEVIGTQSLRITYERAGEAAGEVPVIRTVGAEREKGFVGVVALANVEIAAGKVEGATGIDARELPADIIAMTNQPILLAFRYVGEKLVIPLTVKKHAEVDVLATIVDSSLFTAMQLNDGRRMTKVVYSVRNNRNQFLRLAMPATAEIWSVAVGGNTVSPAKDDAGKLLIPLIRSARGGRELASFPVEIVYVQTPPKAAGDGEKPFPAQGTLHVDLPACGEPVIHLMYSLYLPAEGKYTVGWGGSGFSGPIRLVEQFTSLAAGPGVEVIKRSAAKQVTEMQQQMDRRVDEQAKAAGATPIRVRLPIKGTLFKLEKILALPADKLWFQVQYRNWEVAK